MYNIYTCVHTHMYIHTYIHTYLPTYIHTYIHTYILTYLHTYILTYLHTYILTYLHTYIHTYIHTHTYTHIHTHTHTHIYIYIDLQYNYPTIYVKTVLDLEPRVQGVDRVFILGMFARSGRLQQGPDNIQDPSISIGIGLASVTFPTWVRVCWRSSISSCKWVLHGITVCVKLRHCKVGLMGIGS